MSRQAPKREATNGKAGKGKKRFMEGSEAIAEAAIAAGCRFFAGYPMTPFTELLEHLARRLPEEGGVTVNAESELEAVGMAWGAVATGNRAATGSTGQGLALMQESFSEITRAELPLVIFNMARGQSDYFQATRGGGHGDYRHIVLAPMDIAEAVELTHLAFHLADKWRNPVLLYGDYLLAHTSEAVDPSARPLGEPPDKPWRIDGRLAGSGRSRNVNSLGFEKGKFGIDPEAFWKRLAAKHDSIAAQEARAELFMTDGAELVVVAFGSLAKFARYVVGQLRQQGIKVGLVRPLTLWPFPSDAVARAAEGARRVAVLEQNAGQMIDDVRLAVLGRAEVEAIGEISTDSSGFGVGAIHDADFIERRMRKALAAAESRQ